MKEKRIFGYLHRLHVKGEALKCFARAQSARTKSKSEYPNTGGEGEFNQANATAAPGIFTYADHGYKPRLVGARENFPEFPLPPASTCLDARDLKTVGREMKS